ncbi:large conductance mechanosensitive channel protein MscL [Leptothermofonsia sp. ETS-13]|uniref:large conductance mechanosensitive channel protein MscL n=1 Tax=Leptothermofonsia sp. ETS-13 TaxID=3035696 RepID=UPI003B9F3682
MAREKGGFWSDFCKFIAQGNVVDLAVAVVIGGAFSKIVESFVADIITPTILNSALKAANVENLQDLTVPGTAIKYGSFLAAIINFLVIALALFIVIRTFEKMKRRADRQQAIEEAAPPDPVVVQQQTADALNRLARAMEARGM